MGQHKPKGLTLAAAFAWYKLIPQPAPSAKLLKPCLLWPAGKSEGYGQMYFRGRAYGAHRVAYTLAKGAIPPGHGVDHLCDVRACAEPSHLILVSSPKGPPRSGAKGVYPTTSGKWQAVVSHQGKQLHVGVFETVMEADAAVQAKRRALQIQDS